MNADDKILASEKQPEKDDAPSEANKDKDAQANEAEEKEHEDKVSNSFISFCFSWLDDILTCSW